MLRLAELALFLAPFIVFLLWRLSAIEGGPSTRAVTIAACVLALLAAALIWFSQEDSLPPGATYEPARMQDGRIVSGHAAPR